MRIKKLFSFNHVKELGLLHTISPFYKNTNCDSKHFFDEWCVPHFFFAWFYTLYKKKYILFFNIMWEIFELSPMAGKLWGVLINIIKKKKNRKVVYNTSDSPVNLISDLFFFTLGLYLSNRKKKNIKNEEFLIIQIFITSIVSSLLIWLIRYKINNIKDVANIIFIYYILFFLYLKKKNLI
jgi:hypothetical protein